nr:hypothetical protein [Tanacetum cinerariifolium]
MTIIGARETIGSQVVQQTGIQCFNCKELEQSNWLADTDEEIDERKLEAHYSFMHSEQPEYISNTCVVEKIDSNVIPDSLDMCDNDIRTDQNATDERVVLANLIVVSADKLPILNPNEFDLWKMRIEQYFLMTDYSLWAVILNDDSPIPIRAIEKRFGGNKETKKASEAYQPTGNSWNKTDLEDQHLDDLFNSLKFYEAKVKSSSSTSPSTQNIAFMSSQNTDNTTESVSAVTSVSSASTKVPVSALPNVDTLNGYADYESKEERAFCKGVQVTRNKETQRRNVPVETFTSNALVSQCDGVGSYDWSFQADEEPTNYTLMAFTFSSSSSSDNENENVFEEDIKLLKLDVMLRDNALVDLRKKFKKAEQERDNDELISSESDMSMPTSPVYDRYKSGEGYHVVPPPCTGTFMPPKPNLFFHNAPTVNETVPTVLNIEPSPTKLNKDLSQSNRPSAPIVKDWVSDSEDESEGVPMPTQKAHSFVQNPKHVKIPRPSVKPVEHTIPDENLKKTFQKLEAIYIAGIERHVLPTKHGVTKAHSPSRRPINLRPSHAHSNFHQQVTIVKATQGNPQHALKDKGVIDSGCSRHMTGNISYLFNFEEINGGYVAFGGNPKGGKITGKGKIRIGKLDFDDVYFVKELKFNIFSVLQMCDKKYSVLYTDTECIVLSSDFKLPDNNHVLLRVPRKNNMYNVDLKNIIPLGDLTCIFTKATLDESNPWHRRLGHINFKTMNKLVKRNLVRGLPSKVFENNHTCAACKKGKQHRASYNQPNSRAGIQEHFDVDKVGEGNVQQYVLFPLWSTGSKDPQNIDDDVTFKVKETESDVHVSPSSTPQTKSITRMVKEQGGLTQINDYDFHTCMFACFLSQEEPKREEGIDYEEVFASVTRIEAIRLFLAYALFMGFMVYQMDVKSDFLYETIEEEVYVCQSLGLEDPDYPDKVYKVVKALYGLHQAPRAWYETLANYLLKNGFQKGKIDQTLFIKKQKGLQVKQKQDGIFISQGKYVAEILRKFGLTDGKSASIPIDSEKPLLKDPDGKDVDVHTYRLMIGSLMYLTSSRPDITFAVCACAPFQVTPKASHLHAVKRIFRYLKDKPHLGLWYPNNSPFNLVAYFDSDYAGASLDRKSTTRALRLDDDDSIDCLPNEEIFAELARIGRLENNRKLKAFGLKRLRKVGTAQRVESSADTVMNDQEDASKQGKIAELDADEDVTLEEVAGEVAKDADVQGRLEESQAHLLLPSLMTEVVTAAAATSITAAPMPKASAARRRKGVVIRDPEEIATPSVIDKAYARELEAELNANINWKEVIEKVKIKEKQDNTVMRYQALKRKPQTKAHARKNMMVYPKNMAGFKRDFFKGMTYDDIRPIFEKHFNSIVAFLEKGEKELEEEASKKSKRKSETSKEKAAKK